MLNTPFGNPVVPTSGGQEDIVYIGRCGVLTRGEHDGSVVLRADGWIVFKDVFVRSIIFVNSGTIVFHSSGNRIWVEHQDRCNPRLGTCLIDSRSKDLCAFGVDDEEPGLSMDNAES